MPRYTFTISVLKTPQAVDDTAALAADEWVIINVLENDLGGSSTSLYSILQQDLTVATDEGVSTLLASGSSIWIENGSIVYDAGESFATLWTGQSATDSFNYALRLGNGTLSFARVDVTIYGVGTRVSDFSVSQIAGSQFNRSIAVGDFNSDGDQDFLTASPFYGNSSVYLYLGNGDGTFIQPAAPVAALSGLVLVQSHDLNGDGKLDLITTNYGSSTFSVALGDGAGNFTSFVDYATAGGAESLAFGDVDGDGDADLILGAGGQVWLFRGDGMGGFAAAESLYAPGVVSRAELADLNEDGFLDLIFFDAASQEIKTRLGNGTGAFSDASTVAFSGGIGRIELGDLDGDGNLDLVAAKGESIAVLLGSGDGSFNAPSAEYVIGDLPIEVYLRDVNGDGTLDIVTPSYFDGQIGVLFGHGDGTFDQVRLYSPGLGTPTPTEIGFADFNSDGLLDFVSTNEGSHNLSVFLQDAIF